MKGEKVDLVLHNARIHCLDDGNHIVQAMAINNGKIIETGPDRQIMNKYQADEFMDCAGKDIIPGITDAHGHLLYYAKQKLRLDLNLCKSYDELLVRTENTSTQTKKTRQERWENVHAVFSVNDSSKIRDKHIMLVDDVITTGASTEACAQTLLNAGSKSVAICSLAFTL